MSVFITLLQWGGIMGTTQLKKNNELYMLYLQTFVSKYFQAIF